MSSEGLFVWEREIPDLDAPVLVHSLTGFLDAGAAGGLAVAHLLASTRNEVLAQFDTDELIDYRARRPRMTFASDHFESAAMPSLLLHDAEDAAGRRFLVLSGPEPDYRWNGFVDAVEDIVDRLDVRVTVGLSGVPWPAPHTRPVGITAHGTSKDLIADYRPWVGRLDVPGHISGLMELRLGAAGHPAMGFVAHVPHYLAQIEHHRAAVALLDAVLVATGLQVPTEKLRAAADKTDAGVAEQIAGSAENIAVVHALEQQYDALLAARSVTDADGDPTDLPLPSADEIGAQVERFLADLDGRNPETP